MKKLSIVLIILSLCSCRNLMNKHQNYLDNQNLGKFTVDLDSPNFQAGESGAQFDSPFPFAPLKEAEITILYFPVEDAACLQYKADTYTHYQFWDRDGREAFIKAFNNYNNDFDSQRLRRTASGSTRNQYGTVHGYLTWQMSRFTVRARGHVEFDIGYYFKEKAPFFSVTHSNAYYENNAGSEETRDMYSGERPMYLTKAQAAKIADSFDNEHLQSVVPQSLRSGTTQRQSAPVEYDSYN